MRWSILARLLLVTYVIVCSLAVTIIGYKLAANQLAYDSLIYRLDWIRDTSEQLQRSGRLEVYAMANSDDLLQIFSARSDVELVSLEDCDSGIVGMRSIATMPNLKVVKFSGKEVTPEMLFAIGNSDSVVEIELVWSQIGAPAIAKLSPLKTLRRLKLSSAVIQADTETLINCFSQLAQLEQLEIPHLFDKEALRGLQIALPGCYIVQEELKVEKTDK